MTTERKSRRSAQSGFTLLELLVTLAILSVVSAVMLPAIQKPGEVLLLRTAAIELAASLKTTRTSALRSGGERTFVVDLADRRYWADDALPPRKVPRGIAVAFDTREVESDGDSRAIFRFRPDGSARGGKLMLQSGRASAAILVDWLTGSTRIDWQR